MVKVQVVLHVSSFFYIYCNGTAIPSCVNLLIFKLENHCTRPAQSSHGGCSRRLHKLVYLAIKNGNILVNDLPKF